jgi:hypothetical protein
MNISATDYALQKINEFKSSFFSNSLEGSDQGKHPSFDESSDNEGKVDKVLAKSAHEIVYKYDATTNNDPKSSQDQFQKDLETMAKLQEEENTEAKEETEVKNENNKKFLSKSAITVPEKTTKLIDDSDKGIGYNSF